METSCYLKVMLPEADQLFTRAFHSSPVAIAVSTLAEGRFLEVNASFLRQTGYDRTEVIGRTSRQLQLWAQPADRTRIMALVQERSSAQDIEITICTKSGEVRQVLASLECLEVAGEACVITMFQDITERTHILEALRKSEERYQTIVRATTDAVWDWDLVTEEVQWSPGLHSVFGYPADTLRYHAWWRDHVHPDDLEQTETSVQAALARGERRWRGEYRFRRADGSYAYVLDRGYVLQDASGLPVRMIGAMVDITERKVYEQVLEQRVAERTSELSTLLQIARNVAYTLDLETLLDLILEQLQTVIGYDGASILSLEGDTLRGRAYRGPKPKAWIYQFTMPVDNFIDRQVVASRQPYIIPNMLDDTPATRYFRASLGDRFEQLYAGVRTWMRIPLIAKDQVVGMLSLHHHEPDYFSPHQAELALAFADQAAVAIENARLYTQAQQLAAVEERQRLARELHDSVSQALYGIALGARTARKLLDRASSPITNQLTGPLDYVLQLAEAGLAEMRALIFELRPESLAQEGLVAAIEKQAVSLRTRHQIDVQTHLMPEPEIALDSKQVLYRIAQEALHNVVKHARATQVTVELAQQDGLLMLAIQDNGLGFDTGGEFPGHLGLKSMRERALQLGGTLDIQSALGQGTRVYAQIPGK